MRSSSSTPTKWHLTYWGLLVAGAALSYALIYLLFF